MLPLDIAETEDQAGGRLYPDPAQSLPAPSLSVRGDSLCPGEFAELGAPGVAAQGGNTKGLIMSQPSQAPV